MKNIVLDLKRSDLLFTIIFICELSTSQFEDFNWEINHKKTPSMFEINNLLNKLVKIYGQNLPVKLTLRQTDILYGIGINYFDLDFLLDCCRKGYVKNGII